SCNCADSGGAQNSCPAWSFSWLAREVALLAPGVNTPVNNSNHKVNNFLLHNDQIVVRFLAAEHRARSPNTGFEIFGRGVDLPIGQLFRSRKRLSPLSRCSAVLCTDSAHAASNNFSNTPVTNSPISVSSEARGPATLRLLIRWLWMNSISFFSGAYHPAARDKWSTGLWYSRAKSSVAFEPPPSSRPIEKITVPSESRTFHSVRSKYFSPGVSWRAYRSSMAPSSAFRPFGHQPPCGMPCAMAKSSAARSAPVWPPETILRIKARLKALPPVGQLGCYYCSFKR